MKKLKLQVEQLAVESFEMASSGVAAGTVYAHGTVAGDTCQAVNTCGPQTCGELMCVIDTQAPCGGGGTNTCPPPSNNCATLNAAFTCVGCTSNNYTNAGGDSCDFCMSFYTDSPQRCPCP